MQAITFALRYSESARVLSAGLFAAKMILKCARLFIHKATKMSLTTVAAKGFEVLTALT